MEKKKTIREKVEEFVANRTGFEGYCNGCIGEEIDGECNTCFSNLKGYVDTKKVKR